MTTTLPAPPADPNVLDMCSNCGTKRCPKLVVEGNAVVVSDPDQAEGAIKLTGEQAVRAAEWILERFGKR